MYVNVKIMLLGVMHYVCWRMKWLQCVVCSGDCGVSFISLIKLKLRCIQQKAMFGISLKLLKMCIV